MKKINTDNFERIFQYGFHDTKISSIEDDGLQMKLNFDEGIYLLDDAGKESVLSKPMQMVLKIINYNYELTSVEYFVNITEYGKKTKFIDYLDFKKHLKKRPFGIAMVYYSDFDNAISFTGGFGKEAYELEITSVETIIIREQN